MQGLGDLNATEEYNNQGALIGLDDVDNEELVGEVLGALKKMNPLHRMRTMKKLSAPPHLSKGSRAEMEKHFKELPAHIREGLRNISNAKLPKNQALLVSGIILLAGVAADQTAPSMMTAPYAGIEAMPAVVTGEFYLNGNKKQLIPETSNYVFRTTGYNMRPVGYYKLDNPRVIEDDVLIEFVVELGTMVGINANAMLFCGLHGTITTP